MYQLCPGVQIKGFLEIRRMMTELPLLFHRAFNNKQNKLLFMLPSNITLTNNIQLLLGKYKRQKLSHYSPQQSIFIHPSWRQRQKQSLKQTIRVKQEEVFVSKQKQVEDRIRLIRNYSLKKLQSIERKKKKSIESMRNQNRRANRYHMSVDSTMELPYNESNRHSKSRDESIEFQIQERLMRRRGITQHIIRNPLQKHRVNSIDNKTIEIPSHCLLDYNHPNQERKYEVKRKQWLISRAASFTKQSPREAFPAINSNQQPGDKPSIQNQPLTLNPGLKDKENITPIITPLNLNKYKKKDSNKVRNSKKLFFNRVMKSKTQSLKCLDQKISPWGRLPESILEEESPMMEHQNWQQHF